MLHRGIKFAHAALLVFSAMLAFLALRDMDEEAVIGHSATVEAHDSRNVVDSSRIASAIESFARAHHVNIGHQVADVGNPGGRRHLYLAVGNTQDPSASWIADGYPDFSGDFSTAVHPLDEIKHLDPRGYYFVFGPPQASGELLTELEGLGLSGTVSAAPTVSETIEFFGRGALMGCFLIVLIAGVVLIGAGVILNAKAYGILRLQGRSFAGILGRDLAQLASFWSRVAAGVVTGVLVGLGLYNGLNRVGLYALIAVGLLAVFTLLALLAHVLTLALTYQTRIVHAIKGEVSSTLAMVCAYSIRVPAALLTLAIVVSALTAGRDVAQRQASREAYAGIGDASTVLLSGDVADPSQRAKLGETVGGWIRQAQDRGKVVLAAHTELRDLTRVGVRVPERDVLVVNNTYLAEQAVLAPSGRRYRGVAEGGTKAQILVPESMHNSAGRITAQVAEWLNGQAGFAGRQVNGRQIETLTTRSGQRVFSYGSGMNPDQQVDALMRDPVLVVVPGSSNIFSNARYAAYATQGGVIFTDRADVLAAMSTDVGRYLVATRPVAQHAADQYQDLVREFRLDMFNIAAALAVLLITAISACIIYRRRNAQALFVRYINGWTFGKAYRLIFALEITLALALVGWSTANTWNKARDLQALEAAGVPPPPVDLLPLGGWEPALMLAIAALSLGAVTVVLAAGHRGFVKRRLAEA